MIRNLALAAGLAVLWLLLSGHYDPLFLGLGMASVALTFFIASRMRVVDQEGAPHTLIIRAAIYLPWLMWEVIKSNVDVARRILTPSLPIAPRTFTIRASQTTAVGRVLYANSITLTPGTVTLEVQGQRLRVHALARDTVDDLLGGEMDRRVTRAEGVAEHKAP